jgi:uncharacterized protein DUF433
MAGRHKHLKLKQSRVDRARRPLRTGAAGGFVDVFGGSAVKRTGCDDGRENDRGQDRSRRDGRPKVAFGNPVLAGTRTPVALVLGQPAAGVSAYAYRTIRVRLWSDCSC